MRTLTEYIQSLDPVEKELSNPWESDKALIPWFVPQWVWELPIDEAKAYLKKIGLLRKDA